MTSEKSTKKFSNYTKNKRTINSQKTRPIFQKKFKSNYTQLPTLTRNINSHPKYARVHYTRQFRQLQTLVSRRKKSGAHFATITFDSTTHIRSSHPIHMHFSGECIHSVGCLCCNAKQGIAGAFVLRISWPLAPGHRGVAYPEGKRLKKHNWSGRYYQKGGTRKLSGMRYNDIIASGGA